MFNDIDGLICGGGWAYPRGWLIRGGWAYPRAWAYTPHFTVYRIYIKTSMEHTIYYAMCSSLMIYGNIFSGYTIAERFA